MAHKIIIIEIPEKRSILRVLPQPVLRFAFDRIVDLAYLAGFEYKSRWWSRLPAQLSLSRLVIDRIAVPFWAEGERRFGPCFYANPAWHGLKDRQF